MNENPKQVSTGRSRLLVAVVAVVAVGVVVGAVWAALAPAEQVAAVGDGRGVVLTGESDHRFDALALFLLITAGAGVLLTIGFWTVDSRRGPRSVAEAVVGGVVGAATAAATGLGIGMLIHPGGDGAELGEVVALAPGLSTPSALIAQPLASALTVVLLTIVSAEDDLSESVESAESDEVSREA